MTAILAVDVGNTRAKYGVFETDSTGVAEPIALSAVRVDGHTDPANSLRVWLYEEVGVVPEVQVVSGSNPPERDRLIAHWPLASRRIRLIESHEQLPVEIDVDQPESVGIDRLLTSLAARQLSDSKQPIIVVDAGTATTVNLTTSDGVFRGGAILPGLRLSAHAMHDYTARLPLIDADHLFPSEDEKPDAPLPGRNTVDAMKSGLFWGQVGAVRMIVERLNAAAVNEYGEQTVGRVVMTGGGGRQMVSQIEGAQFVDCLTLHGLATLV